MDYKLVESSHQHNFSLKLNTGRDNNTDIPKITRNNHNNVFFGFYQNFRGLRSKLINFKCNIAYFEHIFLVLTET